MFEFSDVFESELTTRVFLILSILCVSVMAAIAIIISEPAAARPVRRLRGPAARLTAVIGILAAVLGVAWATSGQATSAKASAVLDERTSEPASLAMPSLRSGDRSLSHPS